MPKCGSEKVLIHSQQTRALTCLALTGFGGNVETVTSGCGTKHKGEAFHTGARAFSRALTAERGPFVDCNICQ